MSSTATEKSASEGTAKPASKATTKPVSKATAKPVSKNTAKPVSKNTAKPVSKTTTKAVSKATAKPKAKPVSKAKTKPASEAAAKPVSKTTTRQAPPTAAPKKSAPPTAAPPTAAPKKSAPPTAASKKSAPPTTARKPAVTKNPDPVRKTDEGLPTDTGFRFFLWSSWGYIAAAIVILTFGIVWIAITKGTTFGAYSPLLFVGAGIMVAIGVVDVVFLCHSPNKVFCHGVLAVITFFVFIALAALALVLAVFHAFTINLESAIFKLDFRTYVEKLNLDSLDKIKAVDDGYYWIAFIFGLTTGLILLNMLVLSTVSCCRYLHCHYFVPMFCGFMPMLVGVMGMMFSLSLASLSAMTEFRFSFIYNTPGWWIFITGIVELLLSLLMLGVFFGVTCKSDRNTIQLDASYPANGGFDSVKSRSRVMGKDYWQCRFEFCLFMWLNVVITTPIFIMILVNVIVDGPANHEDSPLLDCTNKDFIDTNNGSAALLSTSRADSFAPLLGQDDLMEELEKLHKGRIFDWKKYKGNCSSLLDSAKQYKFQREGLSYNDYNSSFCTGSSSRSRNNGDQKSAFYGLTEFARKLVARFDFAKGPKTEIQEAETESAGSFAPGTSFAPLNLIDTLMVRDPDQLGRGKWEGEREKEVEADVAIVGLLPGINDTTTLPGQSNNDALRLAPAAATFSLDNADTCYNYSDTIFGWKEDIEKFGADMCIITGIAMLIPAFPVIALDALIGAIIFVIFWAILVWLAMVMGYYVFYIIVYYMCQREVVDAEITDEDAGVVVTYYHIEDHSPGFNCCICCGINGCCVFIKGFTSCVMALVLAFFLSEKVCGCCEDEPQDEEDDEKKLAGDGDSTGTISTSTIATANSNAENGAGTYTEAAPDADAGAEAEGDVDKDAEASGDTDAGAGANETSIGNGGGEGSDADTKPDYAEGRGDDPSPGEEENL